MFDTGVRQLRMGIGMVWGRRIPPRVVERLVADARATLAEFGAPGADAAELVDGPLADPAARAELAATNVRRTARRLSQRSAFYARRFEASGVDVRRLDLDSLRRLPVTVKRDLVERPEEFRCSDSTPVLSTRTTGTTGRPVEIWLSQYECELWPALGALAALVRGDVRPDDVLQVHVSSRATATVTLDVAVCRLIGAGCRMLGLVPPDEALDELCESPPTLLSTCASYLAQLVVAARRRGLGPADFRLRRIDVGGEVLSPSVEAAARATFGAPVNDLFGMTEVLPVTGRTCSERHLHHDINTGHVEYLDLDTGAPAVAGALATVVITPYFPYRECMPVFRYDTRDVVRLPERAPSCELSGLPGTSRLLGKADQLVRLGAQRISPRQVAEAVETLPGQPWPARFRASSSGGRLEITLPEGATAGLTTHEAEQHLSSQIGVDAHLLVVPDEQAEALRPLRCDLRETTFVSRPALVEV